MYCLNVAVDWESGVQRKGTFEGGSKKGKASSACNEIISTYRIDICASKFAQYFRIHHTQCDELEYIYMDLSFS